MSTYRGKVTVMILGTVAIGQLNWYNLPALFPLMSSQLNLSISQLGIISAAFVVGFGLFQVPAGIVAAKVGLRPTVLFGSILISGFSLLVSVSSNPYEIAVLRFVAGGGMALVYAPGMMLAVRYLGAGSQSKGIGLYSAIGDVGGIAGIFGWALLGAYVGWRSSVAIGGALGLVFAVLLFALRPHEDSDSGFRIKAPDIRRVLFSRDILLVGFAMLGMELGWNALVYFIVFYLEVPLKAGAALSGLVGGLILVGAIVGALAVSRGYDKVQNPKIVFFLLAVACAASVVLVSTGTVLGAVSGTFIEGVLNGAGFTFGLVLARKVIRIPRYESLGVAWVGEIMTFGSSWATLLFTSLVALSGYPLAWSVTSLVGIFFILPVLRLGNGRSQGLRPAANQGQQENPPA